MDQDNKTIGFTISDEAGNSCKMDFGLISQLETISVSEACRCKNEISINIKPGNLTETLSCGFNKYGEPAYFIEVLDIYGGVNQANYKIEPLYIGELSTNFLTKSPFRFYYAITQQDLDSNKPLGFKIFDEHSCFYERTFNVPALVKAACEIDCYIAGEIELDENDGIQFGCNIVNDVLVANFNYQKINGGNNHFIYEAMIGKISNFDTIGPGFLNYSFTPEDFKSGQLDFFIKDTAVNCITHIDIAKLITAFPYEACGLCNYKLNLTKNSADNIDIACDLTGDENRIVVTAFIETDSTIPIMLHKSVGELSTTQVRAGEQFQYRFSALDFINPDFGIALSNQFTNCAMINLNYIPTNLFQNCIQLSSENDLNTLESNIHFSQHPAQPTINIIWHASVQVEQIRLYDLQGKLRNAYKVDNGTHQIAIDIINHKPELFVLQMQTKQGLFKKKLVLLN